MRAARLLPGTTLLTLADVPQPQPVDDQVLVRVVGAGVCHSDLHVLDGDFEHLVQRPVTPGHEIAGVVHALGPQAYGIDIGTSVVVMVGWGCGTCLWCTTGHEQLCRLGREAGSTADGGFAEFVLVPHARHVVPLGSIAPLDATPFGCAALCAFAAVQRVLPWLSTSDCVTVIGAGGLGQYAIHYLRTLSDARVIAVDRRDTAVARALDVGAHHALLADGVEASAIASLTGPEGCRAVIDFVGSDHTLALAATLAGTRGVIALLGLAGGTLAYGFESLAPEVTLTTVVAGTLADLHNVVRLEQREPLAMPLTTYPLDHVNRALADLRAGVITGRAVVLPGATERGDDT